jgi:C-terminal processing protease CtpA/Prc
MKIKCITRFLFSSGLFLLFLSCTGEEDRNLIDPDDGGENSSLSETQQVNQFIAEYVEDAYLWTSTVDWGTIFPLKEPDPYAFFDRLMYRKDDKWSMLTDDINGLTNQVSGVSTTFGYQLIFGAFSNVDALFAIILYIYPGTPADVAGLKRGDILISFDGGNITEANRMDLYDKPSLVVGRGLLTDRGIEADTSLVYMFARTMYENPVVKDTVIVKGGHKIGYFCYMDYTEESEPLLQEIFSGFKSKGVTDVVLDLRYNGGGYAKTSLLLSSILAPKAVVGRKDVFLTQVWNDAYMAEFRRTKYDVNEYFTDALPVNMDLSRLYVLTTGNTASASESTIVGLTPYMDVITIGDTTHGKYCGGSLLSPEVWDSKQNAWVPDEAIENWGMYLMLYRFANKNGITSFTGGLAPDVYAEEDYFTLYPFGDERDPLLGRAVAMITGTPYMQFRADRRTPPHTMKVIERRSPLDGKMIDTRAFPRTAP